MSLKKKKRNEQAVHQYEIYYLEACFNREPIYLTSSFSDWLLRVLVGGFVFHNGVIYQRETAKWASTEGHKKPICLVSSDFNLPIHQTPTSINDMFSLIRIGTEEF